MNVVLQTHLDYSRLALREIVKFTDDSGYVAKLQVRSGGFILDQHFYFDDVGLWDFLSGIVSMDQTLVGVAELRTPYDENNFIRLELDFRGSLLVTGESRDYSGFDQSLRFGFITDQTVLAPLARDLRTVFSLDI